MAKYKSQGIILVFLISALFCSSIPNQVSKKIRLVGKWGGKTDNISIIMKFKRDSGFIEYLPFNKKVSFTYRIEKDSILSISNGLNKSLHIIEFLSEDKFILFPYPKKLNSEIIDLIDQVEFVRDNCDKK
ncbi:hypothetical protein D7322_15930 [Sphingobacterium puteale]|uniref:Uncharacterized protein n=1 Tax=Sphingobacterium puteale TaxID=2420510 RepID=A0A420VX00_9SPHI|nr:hypothetical protein [Sphingobacterium puteale]RKO70757.1 hypothetical protein D7322_15930 [Sphingobacterium puteale]